MSNLIWQNCCQIFLTHTIALFSSRSSLKSSFVPAEIARLGMYVIENVPSDNCISILKATELDSLEGEFYGV